MRSSKNRTHVTKINQFYKIDQFLSQNKYKHLLIHVFYS